ncbi:hypothetical protein [Mesorhizobium sp. A556]
MLSATRPRSSREDRFFVGLQEENPVRVPPMADLMPFPGRSGRIFCQVAALRAKSSHRPKQFVFDRNEVES